MLFCQNPSALPRNTATVLGCRASGGRNQIYSSNIFIKSIMYILIMQAYSSSIFIKYTHQIDSSNIFIKYHQIYRSNSSNIFIKHISWNIIKYIHQIYIYIYSSNIIYIYIYDIYRLQQYFYFMKIELFRIVAVLSICINFIIYKIESLW